VVVRGPELVDRALPSRALVYGSLPPHGRDLDLLVRPGQEPAVEAALTAAGFLRRGPIWARFAACTVDVVELTSAASWQLPSAELDALFADARPLDDLAQLVRPAPHHVVLILARRVAAEGGGLDAKRRARLDDALAEDPQAWDHAHARATAWDAVDALERLREHHGHGTTEAAARPRRCAPWPLRRSPGAVIALSGVDGAGKSTQALALRDTLERLGYDATIAWTRIIWDDALWRVALPVKAALGRPLRMLSMARSRLRAGPAAGAGDDGTAATPLSDDPVKRIREGSALLTHAWTMVIALINATSQRRLTRSHIRRGGIVICDRYTLDSIVALRFSYGAGRRFRAQRRVIAALSPTPRRAYLLDVRPETAYARKGEDGVEWLAGHRALYREEHVELGVRLLDGERPPHDLCAEIALDVWQSGL
jgi:thymidylate kinase